MALRGIPSCQHSRIGGYHKTVTQQNLLSGICSSGKCSPTTIAVGLPEVSPTLTSSRGGCQMIGSFLTQDWASAWASAIVLWSCRLARVAPNASGTLASNKLANQTRRSCCVIVLDDLLN